MKPLFETTLIALIVCALLVIAGSASTAETPRVGAKAPGFSLLDENGETHELASYQGKTVVLEWTNPECPYVARHYRANTMERLAEEFDSDVVWLAVNSTWMNTPEQSQKWKQVQGFEYATLQDSDGTVGRLYGATTTPNMFVIDGQGVLRYAGAIDDDPRGRKQLPVNYVRGALAKLADSGDPDPSQTKSYGCSVKYK
jgi:peroxiredoxin